MLIEPGTGRGRAVIGAVEGPPLLFADASPLFGGRIGPDFAERFDPGAADAALHAAGMADAVARHVHVTVLARAVCAGGEPSPQSLPEAA